jgi:hypothetical protein
MRTMVMTGILDFLSQRNVHLEMHAAGIQDQPNCIILEFGSLGEALSLLKPWPSAERRASALKALHELLHTAGLLMEVRVQGRVVAELGGSTRNGLLVRLLGASQG